MSSPDEMHPASHDVAKVVNVGDVIRFYDHTGRVMEGRVARADQLHRASGTPGPWTLFVTPLEDEAG